MSERRGDEISTKATEPGEQRSLTGSASFTGEKVQIVTQSLEDLSKDVDNKG